VTLPLNLVGRAELRLGDGSTRMRVQIAEFGHKQQQGSGGQGGEWIGGRRRRGSARCKGAFLSWPRVERISSRSPGNWKIGTRRTSAA